MMTENVFSLDAWKGKLASSKQGYKKTLSNLMLFLDNMREFGDNLRWNDLAYRPEWNGKPLTDTDIVTIRLLLERAGFEPTTSDVLPAVMAHAKDRSFHPVRDYLRSLTWDGRKRLDHWMVACMGAKDTAYTRMAGRKTLIAAVARAMQPGCKVDTVLVLEGPQGIKKSTAITVLFGQEYAAESVNLFDQHNKMVMSMMGAWCVELAEFIAITKRDENMVKGLLSMKSDRVVLPYAKMASDHPRQCIFFGTINPSESGYLTDATGNRRYWPVEVTKADIAVIAARRDDLWAEAMHAYQAGERWWFEGDDEELLANNEVGKREEYDVWEEILHEKMVAKGITSTTVAAALKVIGVPEERMDDKVSRRVGKCLRALGYISKPGKEVVDGERVSVRIFSRSDP